MKSHLLLLALLAVFAAKGAVPPPKPLYIVNGEVRTEIESIAPEEIEQIEMLPADEETIARYGKQAAHGVMLITLRYDRPALFPADSTFGNYIARQVKWDESNPAARVAVRYRITTTGTIEVLETLEATDKMLKRRVLKAIASSPRWQPARKNGQPVESEGVLSIQLPRGKRLYRPAELVIR